MDAVIFCRKCGEKNDGNAYKCTACGFLLHEKSAPQYVVSEDSTMGGLIPYKNAKALWAYYLGIFSLIPFLGILPGIAALVLGVQGLKYAEENSQAKGKGHAWVGVVLGGISVVGMILFVLLVMVGTLS